MISDDPFKKLENRRLQAISLWIDGVKQIEIARRLKVTKGAVSQWVRLYKKSNEAGLLIRKKTGAPQKLGGKERVEFKERISPFIKTTGINGINVKKAMEMIQKDYGLHYSRSYIYRLLKVLFSGDSK